MNATGSTRFFRPALENLERREGPAALSPAAQGILPTMSLLDDEALFMSLANLNDLNNTLSDQQKKLTNDINSGSASVRTLNLDYNQAVDTYGKIQEGGDQAKNTLFLGAFIYLGTLLAGGSDPSYATGVATVFYLGGLHLIQGAVSKADGVIKTPEPAGSLNTGSRELIDSPFPSIFDALNTGAF
jgi:hypothetical protein